MAELVRQVQQLYVLVDDGNRRALKEVGLTPTQYHALKTLAESEAGELAISRLAEAMLCTRGNITRLIQRMEEAGLVGTRGDARDQRLVLASLTDRGREAWQAAVDVLAEADERRFGQLDADDLVELDRLAQLLIKRLSDDLG